MRFYDKIFGAAFGIFPKPAMGVNRRDKEEGCIAIACVKNTIKIKTAADFY